MEAQKEKEFWTVREIRLPMRHSWQEDPELLHVDLMEPRQRCGLASLEMLIEYYLHDNIMADEIFRRAESFHAINEHNDWWHPGQVKVLTSYGLLAWRRNWTAPTQDPSYFSKHEGYDAQQMKAVTGQIEREAPLRAKSEKLLMAIRESLALGSPILLSVKKGFSNNNENHQVIISGWREKTFEYFVHDPVHKVGPDLVTESRLLDFSNYWAIFTRLEGSSE